MRQNKTVTLLALSAFLVLLSCGHKQENSATTQQAPPAIFPVTQIQLKTVTGQYQ